ncbi:hypothetical protein PGB90_009543 [Kerria lacca]
MPSTGANWTREQLQLAIKAVHDEIEVQAAASRYNIFRITLRNHLGAGTDVKRLSRTPTLIEAQEKDLCLRIIRLADVGMPIANGVLKRSGWYSYCERPGDETESIYCQ